jgi:hypothetical protein
MKIVSCESGEEFEAVIGRATESDLRRVKRERTFGFDWTQYGNCEVYKLTRKAYPEILGLMAIQEKPQPGFQYVEMIAIQSSKPNIGSRKIYDNIAGCLIAYACKIAFKNGCEGYVRLQPKTALYDHYITKYGFVPVMDYFLVSKSKNSRQLIEKYLGNA